MDSPHSTIHARVAWASASFLFFFLSSALLSGADPKAAHDTPSNGHQLKLNIGVPSYTASTPATSEDSQREIRKLNENLRELIAATRKLEPKDEGFFKGRVWDVLQGIGVILGLFFTGYALLLSVRAQRLANLFSVTSAHRDIWWRVAENPKLHRITSPSVNLNDSPVTEEERTLVILLVAHINTCLKFTQHDMLIPVQQFRRDARELFSLPIPSAVWKEIREYQDKDVVELIEGT